ncbi:MAG: ribonuclease H-like domain-containing protein [Colwellia sp.]|nr:ribonuclease H-like domain-containing protein [Colwellia sp.]
MSLNINKIISLINKTPIVKGVISSNPCKIVSDDFLSNGEMFAVDLKGSKSAISDFTSHNSWQSFDKEFVEEQLHNRQVDMCHVYKMNVTKFKKLPDNVIPIENEACVVQGNTKNVTYFDIENNVKISNIQLSKPIEVKSRKRKSIEYDYIPASNTRNFLLKDPIADYLKFKKGRYTVEGDDHVVQQTLPSRFTPVQIPLLRTTSSSSSSNTKGTSSFTSWIMKKGVEFEETIYDVLKQKFKGGEVNRNHKLGKLGRRPLIVMISDELTDSKLNSKFEDTIQAMKDGVPYIYQGVLHDHTHTTFGIPDLLVRADYLNKLTITPTNGRSLPDGTQVDHNPNHPSTLGNYHYVVVDIKCSTMHLNSKGVNLLNSGSAPAYKGQCWVYTQALHEIQGYTPQCAYIFGKGWCYSSKDIHYSGINAFDRLGVIDYSGFDKKYINLTYESIKWLRDLKHEGHNWVVLPTPSREELYPNMCIQSSDFATQKREIADELGEITSIFRCGVKERKKLHKQGIMSWHDPDCNSKAIGIKSEKSGEIVDQIIEVNNSDEYNIIFGKNFKAPKFNMPEIFIDFENYSGMCNRTMVIPSNHNNKVLTGLEDMIFMVGCGWADTQGEWHYECFESSGKTVNDEMEMFKDFFAHLDVILQNVDYKAWHWSNAEITLYDNFIRRAQTHGIQFPCIEFYDLHKIVRDGPVTVKDAFNFSLKSVARAMHTHGMIDTTWVEDDPSGLMVMIDAWEGNNESENVNYNEVDCKVMWEILEYIRRES